MGIIDEMIAGFIKIWFMMIRKEQQKRRKMSIESEKRRKLRQRSFLRTMKMLVLTRKMSNCMKLQQKLKRFQG